MNTAISMTPAGSVPNGQATVQPVLEVEELSVDFPSEAGVVSAVRGVGYRIRPGEVLGIVGESGSGKSVTASAVLGLLPETARVSGSVRLEGRELLGLGDREYSKVRGNELAMVFQDPLSALTPVYSIGRQLTEAITIHRDLGRKAARERAVELLDLVGIPDPRRRFESFPHEFSGGMRQRAVIAMAIANDPKVIIADEPTTALDVTIQAQILDVLHRAREATGAAIVLITHDLGVVAGFADRVMVMYAGRPVETGTVDEVFYTPRMPYTIGLLGSIPRLDSDGAEPLTPIEGTPPDLAALPAGCPFRPRCPIAIEECDSVEPASITQGRSRSRSQFPGTDEVHAAACHRQSELAEGSLRADAVFPIEPRPPVSALDLPDRAGREQVLLVEDLHRHFPAGGGSPLRRRTGPVRAVDGISLEIRAGETLGLVGESGCGKTTTLLQLLELTAPSRGRISVLGRDTAGLDRKSRRLLRRDIQVVFQDPMSALDPRMPIGAILAEPLRSFGMPRERIGDRVAELLSLVGLDASAADRYPAQFSGGQRQRVGIARALALEPRLLVLDEPVSALDVSIQAGVLNLLTRLKAEFGLSYLFVAHDLSVVRHVADRVAVMYLGRIVEVGGASEIFDDPRHPYTQALLSAVPLPDPRRERERERIVLRGDLPSPTDIPEGCRFRARCPKFPTLAEDERTRCIDEDPTEAEIAADHRAACHFASPIRP